MTHKTGPRKHILDKGFDRLIKALDHMRPKAEPREQQHILHHYEAIMSWQIGGSSLENKVARHHRALKKLLKNKKYDNPECPTCPKD